MNDIFDTVKTTLYAFADPSHKLPGYKLMSKNFEYEENLSILHPDTPDPNSSSKLPTQIELFSQYLK
jgi:hypothetical protein